MALAAESSDQSSGAASPPVGSPPWRPRYNPWIIAVTVTMATFMEVLDTSIANVSLPHIAGNLSAGVDESTWVLTSYLVSNAIVLPLSGWLSDVFGRKRFYMTCVALFTMSSFLCGLAPNLGMLIVFRVIQGIGGGGLQPSEQSILADTFEPRQRGMAFAVYGLAVVMAPAIGPTLGGWITDNFNWRWIFFINIPVGIASLILTYHLVEDPPSSRPKSNRKLRVDFIGLGLIAVGLGFLQVVLDKGQRDDWFESTFITTFTIVAVVAIAAAIVWELWGTRDPIVDLHLLGERNFAMANVLMFMLGFVLFGSTVLLPLFLQEMMGYTAETSGMAISGGGIAVMLMMPFVGILLNRVQARWMIALGLLLCGLGLLRMSQFNLGISFSVAAWSRVLQASGLAFLFVPINTVAYAFMPPRKNNNGSGLINLARNVGGSVGISFSQTLLARRAQFHQSVLSSHVTDFSGIYHRTTDAISHVLMGAGSGSTQAVRQANSIIYEMLQRQANVLAYVDVFRLMGMIAICLMPVVLLLKKTDPHKAPAMAH